MSPMFDRLHSGGLPASQAPSSHSVPVSAAAVWSVPGQVRARTLLVATGVAVDEPGVAGAQRLVVDAEARRRSRPPVQGDDVGRAISFSRTSRPPSSLRFKRDAPLAAVGAETHVRPGPVGVVQGMDLDDVGTEVGQDSSGERPGHPEAEIEHPDTLQRMSRLPAESGRRWPSGAARVAPVASLEHLVGVLPRSRRRSRHRPRCGRELEQRPGMADRTNVGIVDLDDTPVGQEGARPPAPRPGSERSSRPPRPPRRPAPSPWRGTS